VLASHSDARVVFAVGGGAALVAALVSTALLLRAGAVTWPHWTVRAPRPRRASAFAIPAMEIGETAG